MFYNIIIGIYLAWVTLGNSLPEFVHFAVEICHCGPLTSASPGFSLCQKLCESAKHQRRHSAWVQLDRQIFEKSSQTIGITLVTVNTCQYNMKSNTRGMLSSSLQSFILNGRGFYYNYQGFFTTTAWDTIKRWPHAYIRIPMI